jgi:hypothetical protein
VPPKRRSPRVSKDEKAAITQAAKDLAKEVNGEIEEIKATASYRLSPEERRAANLRARKRNRARRRNGQTERVYCKGINLAGKPCTQAPLLPENWDGPEEITGLYCLWHEPNIDRDQRTAYHLHGSATKPVPRRVTPAEMAHELILRSPQHFLKPYLKAIGLRLNDNGELEEIGSGLKLYGYSRGGEVIKSRYPDLVGQQHTVERLLDRVWGKPRASVDLASQVNTVAVHVVMDEERIDKVSSVLANAGVLPNGNGNGHPVIEATAEELPVDKEN